jgi:ABC-2 type transport system permease protein
VRTVLTAHGVLTNIVRKEVMVKYKSSVLGLAWSMLNPILYLLVFSFVFGVILQAKLPNFPVYLLSGLLAWNLFSSSASVGARSVVDNANLVTKVYFPREILPLSSVGVAMVDFVLQAIVLVVFMLVLRAGVFGVNVLLLPLSMVALLLFSATLGMFVAALNVRYRDTQHLLNLALLVWFWLTPVIYPSATVYEQFAHRHVFGVSALTLYLLNPMADIVEGFHRALYGVVAPGSPPTPVLMPVSVGWLATALGLVSVGSLVLLVLSWRSFFRRSGDFAEEL